MSKVVPVALSSQLADGWTLEEVELLIPRFVFDFNSYGKNKLRRQLNGVRYNLSDWNGPKWPNIKEHNCIIDKIDEFLFVLFTGCTQFGKEKNPIVCS